MTAESEESQGEEQTMQNTRHGLIAVAIGVVAIVATPAIVALVLGANTQRANDIQTIVGPAISGIAAITAAYFGITLGQAGKAEAEKKKDEAQKTAGDAKAEAAAARAVALSVGTQDAMGQEAVTALLERSRPQA